MTKKKVLPPEQRERQRLALASPAPDPAIEVVGCSPPQPGVRAGGRTGCKGSCWHRLSVWLLPPTTIDPPWPCSNEEAGAS